LPHKLVSPLRVFAEVRILKDFKLRVLEVRIVKGLWRRFLEVRILKEIDAKE